VVVNVDSQRTGGLPGPLGPFGADASPSFFDLLRRTAPAAVPAMLRGDPVRPELLDSLVEGTTVLALTFPNGVIIAGDRRATAGNFIARRDMRKVFPADRHSAVAISGAAGPAVEMARVFATELEHYEKVEGEQLSLEGKANKLAFMVRANMPLAMQGIVVVPLFAGYDIRAQRPSIFEYDPIGGRYESLDHAATGSGSIFARGTLKKGHQAVTDVDSGALLAVQALFDAAEEDSATGGPDRIRDQYPILAVIDADGYRELVRDAVVELVDHVIAARTE